LIGERLIAAVVIASGYSRRMGQSKLTLELGGATFLQRAIRAACEAERIGRRVVVVRPEDEHLVSEVTTDAPGTAGAGRGQARGPAPTGTVETLLNPYAAEGQSASVRLAAAHLAGDLECEAVIYAVVDQPFLNGRVFDTLAEAWAAGRGEILVSTYDGQRGSPVLFGRRYFEELQQLTGDVGGRDVMRHHPESVAEVPMPDPEAGRDIDTWDDYQAARHRLGG
jgi:molybdenum cofactor cytidylyltransferase